MSAHSMTQQSLDVICQHKKDGSIIPLKLRLQDEDGEYQSYMVKSYRQSGMSASAKPPHYSTVMFECKINVFGRDKIIGISYNYTDGLWKVLDRLPL
ncbi:MAG: hypothetical protein K5644_08095 [Lachnospiraceae bacterium]|nr:hypothetical protein [Lachnospiraceae bacterium]